MRRIILLLVLLAAVGYGNVELRQDCGQALMDADHTMDGDQIRCKNWEMMMWSNSDGWMFGNSHLTLICVNGKWTAKGYEDTSSGFQALPKCDGSTYAIPGGSGGSTGGSGGSTGGSGGSTGGSGGSTGGTGGSTGGSGGSTGSGEKCNTITTKNAGSASTTTSDPCPYKPDSFGTEHTMCTYRSKSSTCDITHNGLSEADKKLILHLHNQQRSKIARGKEANQPAAKNMMQMTWNDELESISQRWTDQCVFGHDKNRNLLANPNEGVGQNSYIAMSSADMSCSGVEGAVEGWYGEVTFIDTPQKAQNVIAGTTGENEIKGVIGHYTQVVWAASSELGCSSTLYKGDMCVQQTKTNDIPYCALVTCNYNPGGNGNPPMYATTGDCPAGTTRQTESDPYPGLCKKN